MATYNYTDKTITYASTENGYVCKPGSEATRTVTYREVVPSDFSRKGTLVKGDHTTALPYSASWQETTPLTGDVLLNARVYGSVIALERCARAGRYITGTMPIKAGYPDLGKPIIPPVDPALRDFLRKSATTSALADARRSMINIGVLLAERVETANLIARKCKQLTVLATKQQRASLRRYFASAKSDRRRVARDLAGEHLAFLFGILPLVGEIEGLMDYLSESDPVIVTGRGRRADVVEGPITRTTYEAGPNAAIRVHYDRSEVTRHSVRVSLQYEVELLAALEAQRLGLNPIAVFYDLVPLSFLSDFISNTGTYLRSFGFPGLKYKTGCWTYYREVTRTVVASVPTNPHSQHNTIPERRSVGSGQGNVKAGAMQRIVYATEPSPDWLLQHNLSVSKAFTLASLAIQRYVKPLRRVIRQKPFKYKGKRPPYLPPINYR